MPTQTFSITLPQSSADALRQMVESGEFATESDAVLAALMAFDEATSDEGDPMEEWLRDEVPAIATRMRANPAEGFTLDEVKAHLEDDLKELHVRTNSA